MEQVYTEIEGLLEGTEFGLIKRTGFSEVAHFDVDKGNLVVKLLQSGQFHGGIALGNTEADDGMFMAMNQMENPKFISVIVSNNPEQKTDAKYRLSSVADVHNILRGLAR
jgi:trehalose-6-phosphatase